MCTRCGSSSSGVTTNFVNPSYPGYDSETGTCTFHLVLHSGVCQVRVDFVDTELLPPVAGRCSLQSLQVFSFYLYSAVSVLHCVGGGDGVAAGSGEILRCEQ